MVEKLGVGSKLLPDFRSNGITGRQTNAHKIIGGLVSRHLMRSPRTFSPTHDRPLISRIVRLYSLVLGRLPDPDGLRTYVQILRSGQSLKDIAEIFLDSDEFRQKDGNAVRFRSAIQPLLPIGVSQIGVDHHDAAALVVELIEAFEAEDEAPVLAAILSGGVPITDGPAYPWWAEEQDAILGKTMRSIEAMQPDLAQGPVISAVVVVDKPSIGMLLETIGSFRAQLYDRLELLLAVSDRASRSVISLLRQQMALDDRLKLVRWSRRSSSGEALDAAFRMATGGFVGLVGMGDRLGKAAMLELAHAALTWPNAQILFTDEDAITGYGLRHSPRLKADWDPERMLVQNQLGRFSIFRTELLHRIGGIGVVAAGGEEYDLALRASFAVPPAEIRHVPHVLYHRRQLRPGKGDSLEPNTIGPIANAFVTRTRRADGIVRDPGTGALRVLRESSADRPLVSVIIPNRDRLDLLRPCVLGLLERTAYPRLQVVIVDNDSRDAGTLAFLGALAAGGQANILPFNGPFDWSAMNNAGVAASSGEILLLLNNDTEVIHSDWLVEMVAQAVRPEIGMVGAKLLYPADNTIQHAGIVLAADGAGQHVFRHAAGDDSGYLGQLSIVRTVSAVTGACIAMRRDVFLQVGGLQEGTFRVTNGDVDLCLRVQQHGYRVIWTPFARLWHRELATRGRDDTPEKSERAEQERGYLVCRWGVRLAEDPYWNPNLAVREDGAILAVPSRAQHAWDRAKSGQ